MSDPSPKFNLTPFEAPYLIVHVIGGQIGLPIIVLTAIFHKKIHLHPALVNFLTTWIVYSFSYCFLIYANEAHANPKFSVCLAQAAMIHGASPMTVVAALLLVMHVWSTFHDPDTFILNKPRSAWVRKLLIIAPPYIAYGIFAMVYAIIGVSRPDSVDSGHGTYCSIDNKTLHGKLVPGFCMFIMVLIIGFEVAIIYNFVHRWFRMKKAFPLAERRRPSRSLTFRVVVFSLYSGIATATSFMLLAKIQSPVPYMIQASFPLVAFIVFGTHEDILWAWSPWERPEPEQASGLLVVDRKMSSAPSRLSYLDSPTSPVMNVKWDDPSWLVGTPGSDQTQTQARPLSQSQSSFRSSTDTVRPPDGQMKEKSDTTPRSSTDLEMARPEPALDRSSWRSSRDSPV